MSNAETASDSILQTTIDRAPFHWSTMIPAETRLLRLFKASIDSTPFSFHLSTMSHADTILFSIFKASID
jgi:hypothetical protein